MTRLRRWALARPRVLLVDAPGALGLRWQVEAELDARGWAMATSPADADVLLTIGDLGPELAAAVEVLWTQLPGPRARAHLDSATGGIADALDRAAAALLDAPTDLNVSGPGAAGPDATGFGSASNDPWAGIGPDLIPGGDDDVARLPMAGYAKDRDGLELEQLRVSLGPWLPGWPTGLVVAGWLQGDVLTDPQLRWSDDAGPMTPDADPRALALHTLAELLLVAGWDVAARQARAARTAVLTGAPDADASIARLVTQVTRSRALAWSLRGITAPDITGNADVLEQLHDLCALATGTPSPHEDVADVHDYGVELAALRLVVAAFPMPRHLDGRRTPADLNTDPVAAQPPGGHHGGGHGGGGHE